eukprot:344795-Pyramimonas_sp.AAC.1
MEAEASRVSSADPGPPKDGPGREAPPRETAKRLGGPALSRAGHRTEAWGPRWPLQPVVLDR